MNEFSRRRALLLSLWTLAAAGSARADAVDALRAFVRDVKSGRADFTQTVTSPDGARQKLSSGRFEFQRPNRFRFAYLKPYPQTIVGDGQKVWFHDPDLNQVTVRKWADAVGSSPAALLAGAAVERDFELKALPDQDGLVWVQATPRQSGGTIQWMKVAFRGRAVAVVELADSFGQRSLIRFGEMQLDAVMPADAFRFAVPAGAELNEG
jgi:outer membrane lipoprotein carrier protein